eukprot:COSAG01_NODE_10055_length_2261_cov_1.230342_3_plen_43_part_00
MCVAELKAWAVAPLPKAHHVEVGGLGGLGGVGERSLLLLRAL